MPSSCVIFLISQSLPKYFIVNINIKNKLIVDFSDADRLVILRFIGIICNQLSHNFSDLAFISFHLRSKEYYELLGINVYRTENNFLYDITIQIIIKKIIKNSGIFCFY